MIRKVVAGGTYVDAMPDGAYAAVVGDHLDTHQGPIPLPPGEDWLLFLRVTTAGGFKIAGKSHNAAKSWLWQDGEWRELPDAIGNSPLIFDRLGGLHLSDGSIGSQGWRYVADDGSLAGRLVTGDATYGSTFGLSEWSEAGGLSIGQGHDVGGACVWDGATLRLLEAGACAFVRVQAAGESVAVSFWKQDAGVAVIYRGTLAELRALPPVAAPVPVPVPVPAPIPAPSPEPIPVQINHLDIVRRVADQSGKPDGSMPGNMRFVQAVLAALPEATAGYVGAPAGAENVITIGGVTVRTNRVMYRDGQIYKTITDSGPGGANGVAWNDDGIRPELFTPRVLLEGSVPAPAPTPAPLPPPDYNPRLASLEAMLAGLAQRIAALEQAEADLLAQIHKLETVTAPDLSPYARKGDPVTVTGHVTVYGIRSGDASWKGAIDK